MGCDLSTRAAARARSDSRALICATFARVLATQMFVFKLAAAAKTRKNLQQRHGCATRRVQRRTASASARGRRNIERSKRTRARARERRVAESPASARMQASGVADTREAQEKTCAYC